MLPNIPIFKNNIRSSGLYRSASYNTRNYITRINTNSLNFNENLDTSLGDATSYTSTKIHEWCHWIQSHCSTFGTCIHSLRFSQEMTLLTHLRALPNEVKEEIIQRRKKNQPIFIQNEKTKQPIHQKYSKHSFDINILSQFWFDFQWVITILEDSRIAASNGIPTGEIFSFVLGDIYLYYKEAFGNRKIPSLIESRSWYNFNDNNITRFNEGNEELTSNSIMECSATISELQFLIASVSSYLNNSSLKTMVDSSNKCNTLVI